MVRKQLYIDEDLERALKAMAGRTGRSEAEHVRAALRAYVSKPAPRSQGEADPLLEMIGLVDDPDGPDDVAEEHDRYLYGAPTKA